MIKEGRSSKHSFAVVFIMSPTLRLENGSLTHGGHDSLHHQLIIRPALSSAKVVNAIQRAPEGIALQEAAQFFKPMHCGWSQKTEEGVRAKVVKAIHRAPECMSS